MAEPASIPGNRAPTVLKWIGIVVGTLLVVLLVTLAVLDANADALRGPIARMASAHLGRAVHIDGRLQLHLLSWTPRAIVNQLRIANPDWVKSSGESADMMHIGELQVSLSLPALFKGEVLLPYLGLDDSDINLVRDPKERANWDFGATGAAKPAASAK